MSTRSEKVNKGLIGALIFIALIGNCRAGETAEFTLTNGTFHSGDFEVKMIARGVAGIYVEGRLLATTWNDLVNRKVCRFSQPEITADEKNGELTMIFRRQKKENDTLELTCIYKLKAVKGALELTTDLSSSDNISYFGIPLQIAAEEYDGGTWRSGSEGPPEVIRAKSDYFAGENLILRTYPPEVRNLSFWQKGKKAGFSISNVKGNAMLFVNWWQNVTPASTGMFYKARMFSDGGKKIQRVTQAITPAYRTDNDILAEARAAHVKVDFPVAERYGYMPVGGRIPAQITIAGRKETAGSYAAEFLLLDQTDTEVMKKTMSFDVTETEEGKVIFDFIPPQCALYWMRISLRDKNGSLIYSKEHPFATIVKLSDLKDIPATSPLGGQPLAGGAMPEGRFVGMKWDRFWTYKTDWRNIEPKKGEFNWEESDKMVDEAVKAGNEILWCLCRTPDWASRLPKEKIYDAIAAQYPVAPQLKTNMAGRNGDRISGYAPPADIKNWENFVRAIVRRYKAKVRYWQVWNEPWWDRKRLGKPIGDVLLQLVEENGKVADAHTWGFNGYIKDYADMVMTAAKVIHAEDPSAKVVAYVDYVVQDGASMEEFYKTGAGQYVDVLCLHYQFASYSCSRKGIRVPWAKFEGPGKYSISTTGENNFIRDLTETHFKYTGRRVPVWDTEEGMSDCAQSDSNLLKGGRRGRRPWTQAECKKRFGNEKNNWDWQGSTLIKSEHRNACWQEQSLLFGLGAGLKKVFLHYGHSVSVSGLMQSDYKLPTENGIAWAAMASVLSTFKEAKYSPMGNKELDAVTITDLSGKKTAVVWSHTGERKVSVAIPVDGGFLLRLGEKLLPWIKNKDRIFKGMDWLGNPVELKADQGWLKIGVNEEPLFIHDLNLGGIFAGDRFFLSIKGEKEVDVVEAGKPYAGEITVANPYISSYSIDGVLESSVKPGGKITFKKGVKLAPGEQKTVPFNIVVEGGEEVQVEFALKDQGAELGRLEKTYPIARYQKGTPLPKCPRAIKVDGEEGDWEGIAEHKVDTAGRVLVGLEMPAYEKEPIRIWKGAEDLSFMAKTCWQEDGLYFLVDVKDNEVNPGPGPSYRWDCVEFFIDLRDAAGQSKKEKTPGSVQFSVQPGTSDVSKECKIDLAANDGKYVKAFFMGRKTKTGYILEGRVEPLNKELKEGMMIGLDVAVDDGKEPNPENKYERKSQMVWMGTADNYKDTSKWGKFYLGE